MSFHFVVTQAQRWVTKQVELGDIVVDATAGKGSDTLFLARTVGSSGTVYAFDVQSDALELTRKRLEAVSSEQEAIASVTLLHTGHEEMANQIPAEHHGQISAVMFNLGYLPGSPSAVITRTATTLAALDAALKLLRNGGLLTIVVYPGHEGGDEEAEAVHAWASAIPSSLAQAVVYRFPQKPTAPYLIALNKR